MPYRVLMIFLLCAVAVSRPIPAQNVEPEHADGSRKEHTLAVSKVQEHLSVLQRLARKAAQGDADAYKKLRAVSKSAGGYFERVKQMNDFHVARLGLHAQNSLYELRDIIESGHALVEAHDQASKLRSKLSEIAKMGEDLTQTLSDSGASRAQVETTAQIQVLSLRMARQIDALVSGEDAPQGSEGLSQTSRLLDRNINMLLLGSAGDGIKSVKDPEALSAVGALLERLSAFDAGLQTILEKGFDLKAVRSANESFQSAAQEVQQEAEQVRAELKSTQS